MQCYLFYLFCLDWTIYESMCVQYKIIFNYIFLGCITWTTKYNTLLFMNILYWKVRKPNRHFVHGMVNCLGLFRKIKHRKTTLVPCFVSFCIVHKKRIILSDYIWNNNISMLARPRVKRFNKSETNTYQQKKNWFSAQIWYLCKSTRFGWIYSLPWFGKHFQIFLTLEIK